VVAAHARDLGEDGAFVIGVHNGYAKDWLENRLLSMIKRTLTGIVQRSVEVRFVVWNKELGEEDSGPCFCRSPHHPLRRQPVHRCSHNSQRAKPALHV